MSNFDPDQIAVSDVRPGEDPLETVVFQALGAASTCWERINDAGVFDDGRAREIGERLVAWLRGRSLAAVQLEPGQRVVLAFEHEPADPIGLFEQVRAWQADPGQRVLAAHARAFVIDGPGQVYAQLGDGCVGEHSPAVNAGCSQAPVGDIYAGEREAAAAGESQGCPAALNVAGEHVPCTLRPGHTGWAHANSRHEVIWKGAGAEVGG